MSNQKTTQMVQSKLQRMFEGIHVVLDELMNRRDLADPTQVSIAIKQMELAETIFVKSLKIKEKNNV